MNCGPFLSDGLVPCPTAQADIVGLCAPSNKDHTLQKPPSSGASTTSPKRKPREQREQHLNSAPGRCKNQQALAKKLYPMAKTKRSTTSWHLIQTWWGLAGGGGHPLWTNACPTPDAALSPWLADSGARILRMAQKTNLIQDLDLVCLENHSASQQRCCWSVGTIGNAQHAHPHGSDHACAEHTTVSPAIPHNSRSLAKPSEQA